MRETFDIIKRVLKSKKIKEINEIIPESFYEKSSLVLIMLSLFIFPHEIFIRYTQHALSHMVEYFYIIGYIIVFFVIITLIIRGSGFTKIEMKNYFKNHIYDGCFILYLILTTISALCSRDIKTAIYGAWGRNCGLRSYYIFFSMYVLGRYIKNSRKSKLIIYATFMIICSIQNIMVLTLYLGYFGRMEGAFHNINHAGYFMVISIVSCIGFIVLTNHLILKILGYAMYIFNIWALIVNNSFGPFLALAAAIILLFGLYIVKYKKLKWTIVSVVIIFVIECIIMDYKTGNISANFRITTNDTKMIVEQQEGNLEGAGSGRMGLWIGAIKVIKNNPVLGVGPDVMNYNEPHNEILQIISEEGIPAGICYLCAIVAIYILVMKKKIVTPSDSLIIEISAVSGYIVSGMFGVIMYYTFGYYLFFLGMLCSNKNSI